MLTAHLPSGYVLYRAQPHRHKWILASCLAGAAFPDLDLIWFYLIDDRAFHHHRYWVHAPGFWLITALCAAPLLMRAKPLIRLAGMWFFAAWFMHLCLDTIVGSIMWLWPFSSEFYQFATVPATHSHFVLSFMLHWSFALEIIVWLTAIWLWTRRSPV